MEGFGAVVLIVGEDQPERSVFVDECSLEELAHHVAGPKVGRGESPAFVDAVRQHRGRERLVGLSCRTWRG